MLGGWTVGERTGRQASCPGGHSKSEQDLLPWGTLTARYHRIHPSVVVGSSGQKHFPCPGKDTPGAGPRGLLEEGPELNASGHIPLGCRVPILEGR